MELKDGTVLNGSIEVDVSGMAFTKREILFTDSENKRSAYNRNDVKRITAGSIDLITIEHEKEKYLASYLEEGKKSLLISSSNEIGTLYFLESGRKIDLLPDPTKPLKNNWSKDYKEILADAFISCQYISPYIDRTDYTKDSLKNLFYIYNNCERKDEIKGHELKNDWSSIIFVVHAGAGYSRLDSKEMYVSDTESATGLRVGMDVNYIPEYEYSKLIFRSSLVYSSEQFTGGYLDYQNTQVRNDIDLKLFTAKLMAGFRMNAKKPVNFYLLTGPSVQFRLNNGDDAFILIDEDGNESPLFTLEDPSVPLRYKQKAPGTALGWSVEFGNFFPIGLQRANIGLGLDHCWFLNNSSRAELNKTTFYLKAGIELF